VPRAVVEMYSDVISGTLWVEGGKDCQENISLDMPGIFNAKQNCQKHKNLCDMHTLHKKWGQNDLQKN